MSFNWAGAAEGMDDALQQAIKTRLLQEESRQRQQQINDNSEWRKLQAEQNRISNESLGEQRRASAEERRLKTQALEQRRRWAVATAEAGPPQEPLTDDAPPPVRLAWHNYLTARQIATTGEELPDSVTQRILTPNPRKEDPNLLSPEALKQKEGLLRLQAQLKPKPAGASGAAAQHRAETQQGHVAVQNYLSYLRSKYSRVEVDPKTKQPRQVLDLQGALNEFDTQPDKTNKGRGKVNLGAYRNQLIQIMGGTPKQAFEWGTYNLLNNPGQPEPEDEDEE